MDQLTAVFWQDGDWWVGSVEELPGANTQGRTLDEARENLRDAARMVVAANRELARRNATTGQVIRERLALALD